MAWSNGKALGEFVAVTRVDCAWEPCRKEVRWRGICRQIAVRVSTPIKRPVTHGTATVGEVACRHSIEASSLFIIKVMSSSEHVVVSVDFSWWPRVRHVGLLSTSRFIGIRSCCDA
jgi:hypothetical protein